MKRAVIGREISSAEMKSPSAVLNLWDLGNQYVTIMVADVNWRISEHSGAVQYYQLAKYCAIDIYLIFERILK